MPRPAAADLSRLTPGEVLAVVPAYNEASNLRRVVGELRECAPTIDVLVVNDGSTDATAGILTELGVQWLTLAARVGVGGAVRAGLRYAVANGYRYVVRIDGDGQHRASDIGRLLYPVLTDQFDVAIGSRFLARRRRRFTMLRGAQALLAVCLSTATNRRITDATSGFGVFGPRALRLLAQHHPTGYAEPELLLLLRRNGLRAGEIPVRVRPRLNGRTSLTPARALVAFGRTLVALFVVPARRAVADAGESS
jgi:glycosyltransferase involved in cell wall biosynthesis